MTNTKARVIYFVKELGGIITGDGDYCTAHLDHQVDGEAFVELSAYISALKMLEELADASRSMLDLTYNSFAKNNLSKALDIYDEFKEK